MIDPSAVPFSIGTQSEAEREESRPNEWVEGNLLTCEERWNRGLERGFQSIDTIDLVVACSNWTGLPACSGLRKWT